MKYIRQTILLCAIIAVFTITAYAYSPEISQGQEDIVKRARQLVEIEWTPMQDIYQWDYAGVFKSGVTYSGIPYGQPVSNGGFIGWNISINNFLDSVYDNTSKFYSGYSWYNKIAPYYSSDCSGFVSYAWQTKQRFTTASLSNYADKVTQQNVAAMEVGDALNKSSSHVVLISAIDLGENGAVVGVEIMEQTLVIAGLTGYGTLGSASMTAFEDRYFGHGYILYRYPKREEVTYTHSCAVPIDGDYCEQCQESAPLSSIQVTNTGRRVTLKHGDSDAVIYYTTDGSIPTDKSKKYTSSLDFSESTIVKAIAVTEKFSESRILTCRVSIDPASAPVGVISEGIEDGNRVSRGSKLSLSSSTDGAVIYYTTDGTTPSQSSKKYSSEIIINSDKTIKAIAVCPGYSVSNITSFPLEVAEVYTITVSASSCGSVSPKGVTQVLGGNDFVLKITPDNGAIVNSVAVNGANIGAVREYSISNISNNWTIAVEFKDTTTLPFSDVSEGAWYRSAVSYAYKNALFKGTSDSAFSPDLSMTRGMFVTVLGRLAGLPSSYTGNIGIIAATEVRLRAQPSTSSDILGYFDIFTPVSIIASEGDWHQVNVQDQTGWIRGDLLRIYDGRITNLADGQYYSNYVKWACLMGIAGSSGGDFRPNDSILRQDMAVMLYNYSSAYNYELPSTSGSSFTDDVSISSYAVDAVYALRNASVISGMGDGSFSPQGTAARVQVAQIFLNFNNTISD